MNGYTPHDPVTLLLVGIVLAAMLLAGLALSRLSAAPGGPVAGLAADGRGDGRGGAAVPGRAGGRADAGHHRGPALRHEGGGQRRGAGGRHAGAVGVAVAGFRRPVAGHAAGALRSRPGVADNPAPGPCSAGAACSGCLGLVLGLLAWLVWHHGRPPLSDEAACVLATVLLLPGLSLMLHFGIFNVLAGLWRLAGVDARPLFRAPLAARSLENFWSRRWNLAFSEMTALGIYRPLSGSLGRKAATVAAFLASGLLHELAISVPVLAGFGLPLLYFLLHGTLVLAERGLERAGRAVTGWGLWAHVWVLGWLRCRLPILFHPPFLRGVVWPLIGLE